MAFDYWRGVDCRRIALGIANAHHQEDLVVLNGAVQQRYLLSSFGAIPFLDR